MVQQVFEWKHGGEKVVLTGDFDDWSQSVVAEKGDDGVFRAKLERPPHTKIIFKFVVDEVWRNDDNYDIETDESGNQNNVHVYPANTDAGVTASSPTKTAAALAKASSQQPLNDTKEKEVAPRKSQDNLTDKASKRKSVDFFSNKKSVEALQDIETKKSSDQLSGKTAEPKKSRESLTGKLLGRKKSEPKLTEKAPEVMVETEKPPAHPVETGPTVLAVPDIKAAEPVIAAEEPKDPAPTPAVDSSIHPAVSGSAIAAHLAEATATKEELPKETPLVAAVSASEIPQISPSLPLASDIAPEPKRDSVHQKDLTPATSASAIPQISPSIPPATTSTTTEHKDSIPVDTERKSETKTAEAIPATIPVDDVRKSETKTAEAIPAATFPVDDVRKSETKTTEAIPAATIPEPALAANPVAPAPKPVETAPATAPVATPEPAKVASASPAASAAVVPPAESTVPVVPGVETPAPPATPAATPATNATPGTPAADQESTKSATNTKKPGFWKKIKTMFK